MNRRHFLGQLTGTAGAVGLPASLVAAVTSPGAGVGLSLSAVDAQLLDTLVESVAGPRTVRETLDALGPDLREEAWGDYLRTGARFGRTQAGMALHFEDLGLRARLGAGVGDPRDQGRAEVLQALARGIARHG